MLRTRSPPVWAGCVWRRALIFVASLLVLSLNVRDAQAWTAAECNRLYPSWGGESLKRLLVGSLGPRRTGPPIGRSLALLAHL
jgi:hypothetical protein